MGKRGASRRAAWNPHPALSLGQGRGFLTGFYRSSLFLVQRGQRFRWSCLLSFLEGEGFECGFVDHANTTSNAVKDLNRASSSPSSRERIEVRVEIKIFRRVGWAKLFFLLRC